jgi:hypothetical protein
MPTAEVMVAGEMGETEAVVMEAPEMVAVVGEEIVEMVTEMATRAPAMLAL